MNNAIKPDYYTRRSRARSDLLAVAGWFARVDGVDNRALKAELLEVFKRHVPRDEPKGKYDRLPCPKCGMQPTSKKEDCNGLLSSYFECANCFICGYADDSYMGAVNGWNRRVKEYVRCFTEMPKIEGE